MVVNYFEVEEELTTMATLFLAEVCGWEDGEKVAAKRVEEADFRGADLEAGERTCRSSDV